MGWWDRQPRDAYGRWTSSTSVSVPQPSAGQVAMGATVLGLGLFGGPAAFAARSLTPAVRTKVSYEVAKFAMNRPVRVAHKGVTGTVSNVRGGVVQGWKEPGRLFRDQRFLAAGEAKVSFPPHSRTFQGGIGSKHALPKTMYINRNDPMWQKGIGVPTKTVGITATGVGAGLAWGQLKDKDKR